MAHHLDGGGRARVGDGGADDHLDAGVFQNLPPVRDTPGLREALRVGRREIVLDGMHRNEFGAGVEQRHRLAVNVRVVQADGREPQGRFGGHRFMPECATPSMIRRWKKRKNRKIGSTASTDIANIWPQADCPVESMKARSASGRV